MIVVVHELSEGRDGGKAGVLCATVNRIDTGKELAALRDVACAIAYVQTRRDWSLAGVQPQLFSGGELGHLTDDPDTGHVPAHAS